MKLFMVCDDIKAYKPPMYKKHVIALSAFAALGFAITAPVSLHAQTRLDAESVTSLRDSLSPDIIVELFTSQGCSSCPPANKFAAKLSQDPEKLVLTYGVTYWDYLGWKDTFGQAKFTDRQRAYGRALHIGNVYTPQIVLNGSAHSPRYSRNDVETMTLRKARPTAHLTNGSEGLEVTLPQDVSPADVQVALITYIPGEQTVDVSKGENQGRTLRVANVVKDVKTLPPQAGHEFETQIRPETGLAYASLVHDIKTGKIITAARYRP